MKKILSISFVVVFLLSACAQQGPQPTVKSRENTPAKEGQGSEKVEPTDEELAYAYESKDFSVSADSVLVDDTNIGFNYEPEMLLDRDFSTGWCSTSAVGSKLTFDFNDKSLIDHFGIVPGFARDETIYSQNNRLKEIKVTLSDSSGESKDFDFSFEDKYGMQFVDFKEDQVFQTMTIEVVSVYPGSKYKDTCIAELDLWSDYVRKQDAVAALAYYQDYKQKDALRPYDIIGKITLSSGKPDSCGKPGTNSDPDTYVFLFPDDGSYSIMGNPVYFSAYVNQFGKVGDEVDATLYWEETWFNPDGPHGHVAWWVEKQVNDLKVTEACDGSKYVHFTLFDDGTYLYLDRFRLDLARNGKLVGRVYFNGSQ